MAEENWRPGAQVVSIG